MKLHRIRLWNFRGVVESDVSFADNGVTIIEGPNEVGKTSIADALRLAIETPDTSKKAQIESAKPVDRDEDPEVEIEMTTGPYNMVYRKLWLGGRGKTTLTITSPQNENLSGRDAHDRVQKILKETLDNDLRRAMQELQIDQGAKLTLPAFSLQSLDRALGIAAGGDSASESDEPLLIHIRSEYEKYWTPKAGQVRDARKLSQRRVEEASDEVDDWKKQIEEIDKDTTEIKWLGDEVSRIRSSLDDLEKNERDLLERWAFIEGIRRDIERLDASHKVAQSRRDHVSGEWSRRQEMIRDLGKRTEELAALEAEVEKAAPALAEAIRRNEETNFAQNEADAALRCTRDRHERAVNDHLFLRNEFDVRRDTGRYQRYKEAEKSLRESEKYLEAAKVDDGVVEEIEKAYLEDQRAKAATDSVAASVEAMALTNVMLEVSGREVWLAANEVVKEQVEDEIELVIHDVARVRVSAGQDAKERVEKSRRASEVYQGLCDRFGVADLNEARRAAQGRRDALRIRNESLAAMKREIPDITAEHLKNIIEDLSTRVATYREERAETPPMPANEKEALTIAKEAEVIVKDCETRLLARQAAAENAKEELDEVKLNEAELEARRRVALGGKNDAEGRLATAREGQSDGDLSGTLALAQREFDDSLKSLEDMRAQMQAEDPESLKARLDNAQAAKRRAIENLETNRERQRSLQASLDFRSERGPQGSYDEAESKLKGIKKEHERTEARAEAAKLLHDTFEKHRKIEQQRRSEPFKARIEAFGRIVFGRTFMVELDDELRIVGRTLNGIPLNADQLSTGAREQLGVLSRLACAAIVSPEDGGAPVIIDDALGWSDPQRLERMGAAIDAAGKQCQIIILTCYPERYAHVGNATPVKL